MLLNACKCHHSNYLVFLFCSLLVCFFVFLSYWGNTHEIFIHFLRSTKSTKITWQEKQGVGVGVGVVQAMYWGGGMKMDDIEEWGLNESKCGIHCQSWFRWSVGTSRLSYKTKNPLWLTSSIWPVVFWYFRLRNYLHSQFIIFIFTSFLYWFLTPRSYHAYQKY